MSLDATNSDDSRDLVVTPAIRIPLAEFTFEFVRSSGPGGQNVNKVSSKARLRWPLDASPSLPEGVKQRFRARHRRRITSEGELVLSSQRYRDQERNKADCLDKLRALIAEVATPPKPRKRTKATRGSKERRLKHKREASQKKQLRRSPKWE